MLLSLFLLAMITRVGQLAPCPRGYTKRDNNNNKKLGSQPTLMSTETVMSHLPSHAPMGVNGIGRPKAWGLSTQTQLLTAIKLETKTSVSLYKLTMK